MSLCRVRNSNFIPCQCPTPCGRKHRINADKRIFYQDKKLTLIVTRFQCRPFIDLGCKTKAKAACMPWMYVHYREEVWESVSLCSFSFADFPRPLLDQWPSTDTDGGIAFIGNHFATSRWRRKIATTSAFCTEAKLRDSTRILTKVLITYVF